VWQERTAKAALVDSEVAARPGKEKKKVAPAWEVAHGGKKAGRADRDPHVEVVHAEPIGEIKLLARSDMAAVGSCAPVVEQVEWADVAESLPGADPEEIRPVGPAHEDKVVQMNRSWDSPT
jgi:hypothetical protein